MHAEGLNLGVCARGGAGTRGMCTCWCARQDSSGIPARRICGHDTPKKAGPDTKHPATRPPHTHISGINPKKAVRCRKASKMWKRRQCTERRPYTDRSGHRQQTVNDVPTHHMVGVAGFEPTTSSSRTKRATKLRHTPCDRSSIATREQSAQN